MATVAGRCATLVYERRPLAKQAAVHLWLEPPIMIAPRWGRSIAISLSVCLSVCLSVRKYIYWSISSKYISGTARPIMTKFCVRILCDRGSVLLCRRCDMLCTSGFMDAVTFGRNGSGISQPTTTSSVATAGRSGYLGDQSLNNWKCLITVGLYLALNQHAGRSSWQLRQMTSHTRVQLAMIWHHRRHVVSLTTLNPLLCVSES